MTVLERYPGAIWHPSSIAHSPRESTVGIVEHQTAGHIANDIVILSGVPNAAGDRVDVHFEVAKAGEVYQFLPLSSEAYHAFHTANHYTVGVEHEMMPGESWTPEQFAATTKLQAWIIKQYPNIPLRHVNPVSANLQGWHGFTDHKDLAGIEGNNHGDGVPANPGWTKFLAAVQAQLGRPPVALPHGNTLRLWIKGHDLYAGWDDCLAIIRSIAHDGFRPNNNSWITWNGHAWYGQKDVINVCVSLAHTFNL